MAPSNKHAYARLLVLKGVVLRAFSIPAPWLEDIFQKWSKDEQQEYIQNDTARAETIIGKLKELGAWNYVSPDEVDFLQRHVLNIGRQEHINAIWCKEGAHMIMWALGLCENWPDVDQEMGIDIFKNIPSYKIGLFARLPELRCRHEIENSRDLMEAWHWRVRTRRLIEQGEPFPVDENMQRAGLYSYDDVVRFSAKSHYQDGDISEILDEDFVFLGKPFRDLSDEEFELASSIISERHYALNWLCGMAPGDRWDETPTDT